MSIDKNYPAFPSVIYNLQGCKVAPVELESDTKETCDVDSA